MVHYWPLSRCPARCWQAARLSPAAASAAAGGMSAGRRRLGTRRLGRRLGRTRLGRLESLERRLGRLGPGGGLVGLGLGYGLASGWGYPYYDYYDYPYYPYSDPYAYSYAPGYAYTSPAPAPVVTGRSVATGGLGDFCATPVRPANSCSHPMSAAAVRAGRRAGAPAGRLRPKRMAVAMLQATAGFPRPFSFGPDGDARAASPPAAPRDRSHPEIGAIPVDEGLDALG